MLGVQETRMTEDDEREESDLLITEPDASNAGIIVPDNDEDIKPFSDDFHDPITDPSLNVNKTVNLNYECPECGGRFNSWDSGLPRDDYDKRCPFCHVPAGEFGDDDREELREENERLKEQIEELQSRVEYLQGAFE